MLKRHTVLNMFCIIYCGVNVCNERNAAEMLAAHARVYMCVQSRKIY